MSDPLLVSTDKACKLTGASYWQLDYWVRTGLFGEALKGHGSGSHRRWDEPAVITARVIVEYTNLGTSNFRCFKALEATIRAAWEHAPTLAGAWLVITHDAAIVTTDLKRPRDLAVLIRLEQCAAYVRAAWEAEEVASSHS